MHAANMAAATGEQTWIDTYAANLPAAENAIRNAMEMARPEIASSSMLETKVSRDRLVELDRHVFDAVRNHDTELARGITADPVYQYHKQIVADGTGALRHRPYRVDTRGSAPRGCHRARLDDGYHRYLNHRLDHPL